MEVVDPEVALTVFPFPPRVRTSDGIIIDCTGIRRHEDGSQTSVFLQILNYQPYVYIELDNTFINNVANVDHVIEELSKILRSNAPSYAEYVEKQPLQVYRPKHRLKLLKLYFKDLKSIFYTRKLIKDENIRKVISCTGNMYEDDVDPVAKMLVQKDMTFSQWFTCKATPIPRNEWISFGTTGHQEYAVHWTTIAPVPIQMSETWPLNINVMSFDIEAYSAEENRMPCPYFYEEAAYLNTCIFQNLSDISSRRKHVLTLLPCNEIAGAQVHLCLNEGDLIQNMANLVQHYQPDIITGYNITGFDFEYLHIRLQMSTNSAQWPTMGRVAFEDTSKLEEISWSSSGAGDIKGKQLKMTGRIVIDTYSNVTRNYKLARYDLNTVGMKFLKKGKHPIKAKEQFAIYKNYMEAIESYKATPEAERNEAELTKARAEYTRVVEYCIQDSELVIELFEKLNIWPNLRATSSICNVPVTDILTKGETIKSTMMLYSLAYKDGFVLTPVKKQDYDYEGGLVQEPVRGFHRFVVCEDFSSMYPSIMQQLNTDPTTLVEDPTIPDSDCEMVDVRSKDGLTTTRLRFIKKAIREGLAPRKVRELIAARKMYKKLMAPLSDPLTGLFNGPPEERLKFTLYDCFQNRLKIAANSLYGYFGANFNKYACIQVAMAVTARGRELITQVCDIVKNKYNGRIIYGDTDSVMVDAGIKNGKDCHRIGTEMAEYITSIFPPPLAIAYEKSMDILCLQKKHYAAFLIDKEGNPINKPERMLSKGIITARRDYTEWVQDVYKELLMHILSSGDLRTALVIVVKAIKALITNQVPVKKLILIKRYTSNAGDNYYVKQFVDRKRREGRTYQVGDRVEYVFIQKDGATKAHEKMESIEDFDSNVTKLDLQYYLEHQFKKPIDDLIGSSFLTLLEAQKNAGYRPGNRRKHFCSVMEPVKMMITMMEEGVGIDDVPDVVHNDLERKIEIVASGPTVLL